MFLPVVALGLYLCPLRYQRHYLLLASYAFYASAGLLNAGLLFMATMVTYVCARRIAVASEDRPRRAYLILAVASLLTVLAVFKYLNAVGASFGVATNLVIPIGISYYTFKLLSLVIDTYWDKLGEQRLVSVASYAFFFPQIPSGPLQRAGDFFAQTEPPRPAPPALIASGLRLILFGCFKKLVLADRLGLVVDPVFRAPADHSGTLVLIACYLFALQLYTDFSGITDMAIGIGRVLGINAPQNFDRPFLAANIQEFWRRWHITLTRWLGDYLFTPLRMALREWGHVGLIVCTMVNMAAIGLWHGPRLTYLVFGLINGVYLVVSALTLRSRNRFFKDHPRLAAARGIVGPLIAFHLVVVGFVVFRAETLGEAGLVLGRAVAAFQALPGLFMLRLQGHNPFFGLFNAYWKPADLIIVFVGLGVAEGIHILHSRGQVSWLLTRLPRPARWAVYYAFVLATFFWGISSPQQFIYFKF